jgi:hypothetical protein
MKIIIDAPSTAIADAIEKELARQVTNSFEAESLRDKAINVSRLRTEIANEVNTKWTPINLEDD